MKKLAVLLVAGLAACASTPPEKRTFPETQEIINGIAARHGDLVRLTIHAIPTGGRRCRVIASTSAAKLDHWSDPEDVTALKTGKTVEKMEGANLDYTVPVMDNTGKPIAVVGVTVAGTVESSMLTSAKEIAGEASRAILQANGSLW